MRKSIKVVMLLLLFVPFVTKAKTYDYENSANKANNYIFNFKDYREYIIQENMPYDYSESKNRNSLKFKKGGFLSRDEFEITNVYNTSYLATGIEYWTLSQHSNMRNYVVNYTLTDLELDKKTGVRVTQFVKNEAKINGSGTKNDPWYFQNVISINLASKDEERATLSSTKCNNISEGKKSITINMYDGNNTPFDICESPNFRYYSKDSSCKEFIKYDNVRKQYYLSGKFDDNAICYFEFVHRTHKISLEQCNDCEQKTKPTTIYLAYNKEGYFYDDIGRKPISQLENLPSKKGFTFEGYYINKNYIGDPVINKDGEFKSTDMNSDTTLFPYMRAHKYTVNYNCNGGTGTTNPTHHVYATPSSLRETGCKKDGYIFKGWSDTSTGSVKYAEKGKVSTLTEIDNGSVTLYAVWEACKAGTYNNDGDFICEECEAGTYSNAGSSKCTNCPPGKFNTKKGSPKCDDCTPGYYCPGINSIIKCDEGYSSPRGASSKDECLAYRCASGTLTYDDEKGYICVRQSDEEKYKCKCETCKDPYTCEVSQDCGTYSTQTYTYQDSCPQSGTCITKHTVCVNATCSVTRVETNYETCTKWYSCTKTGTRQVYNPAPCYGTCYGDPYECNCQTCYSYSCPSGWSKYKGSNKTLTCYKYATIG